jgi:transcriptional regulator with GAF, ATPase, and Fis domain
MGGSLLDPPIITEILQQGDQLTLRTRTIRVEVLTGPSAGQSADLAGPEARVGSGRGVDLLLLDGAVSRHHLTLRAGRDGLRVIDAGSRNGTTVDGVRVVDGYARQGSIVGLGTSTLRVMIGQGTVDLPLSPRERFGGLLGRSIAMRRLFTILERVAATDDAVLVEGETGTGKELVAEALHEEGARAGGPFVVFDCSAVAANLIESELFGHVRGAFTGATVDRAGAFEAADAGTLFLDEIGELPLTLQPKLLRALEKLEVRRVGANTPRRVDVRIVAATNRNLAEEVGRGTFREDLFYRLAVVRVALPPLRDRADDIELLARHFAEAHGKRAGRAAALDEAALRALRSRAYPGNVRDLRNAVARTLSLGHPDATGAPSQPPASLAAAAPGVDLSVPFMEARDRLVSDFERAYLREALRQCGGNATKAAERVGLNRKFLQRAIARHGLREDD